MLDIEDGVFDFVLENHAQCFAMVSLILNFKWSQFLKGIEFKSVELGDARVFLKQVNKLALSFSPKISCGDKRKGKMKMKNGMLIIRM